MNTTVKCFLPVILIFLVAVIQRQVEIIGYTQNVTNSQTGSLLRRYIPSPIATATQALTDVSNELVYLHPYPYALTKERELELLHQSQFNKTTYFNNVRSKLNTRVTAIDAKQPCLMFQHPASLVHPKEFLKQYNFIIIIGDSISRESALSIQAWSNNGLRSSSNCNHNTTFFKMEKSTYGNVVDDMNINVSPSECCSTEKVYVKYIRDEKLNSPHLNRVLDTIFNNCPCNGVVWAGAGLWNLLRTSPKMDVQKKGRVQQIHHFGNVMAQSAQNNPNTNLTLVWQSTGSIDSGIISAYPPRKNFYEFYPTILLEHFVLFDKVAFTQLESNKPSNLNILMDPIIQHHKIYPGIRCDGMHYASRYDAWDCGFTMYVVDVFIQKVLNKLIQ